MGTIPKLEDCKPGIRPTGFNLLVAVSGEQDKTQGGIWLADSTKERNKLVEVRGRVVAMSPACFDFAKFDEASIPKVGEAVQFANLAGIMTTGADGNSYRIIQDKSITAIIEETGDE